MFSAMLYLKNKDRHELDEPHLNVVARFFHQQWCNYKSFPYNASFDIWHAGAPKRSRYGRAGARELLGSCHHKPESSALECT